MNVQEDISGGCCGTFPKTAVLPLYREKWFLDHRPDGEGLSTGCSGMLRGCAFQWEISLCATQRTIQTGRSVHEQLAATLELMRDRPINEFALFAD